MSIISDGPFFGRVQSDNSDVNGDSPERNGNRASSVEGTVSPVFYSAVRLR